MKEKKVYFLDCAVDPEEFDFRRLELEGDHEAIKKEAIRREAVYTLREFQEACNDESLTLFNAFILID